MNLRNISIKRSELYILVVTIHFVFLFGCHGTTEKESSPTRIPQVKEEFLSVNTYLVNSRSFDYTIQGTGKIKAAQEQKMIADHNDLIVYSRLANGVRVNSGAVLLRFDDREEHIKVDKAEQDIFNSKLNYKSELLSQESLLRGRSKGVNDTVNRKLKINSGLSAAEFELKNLRIQLENLTVNAPFTGRLASVKAQRSQYVRAGDELFTIYSDRDLFLEARILEIDIAGIHPGQKAFVTPVSGQAKFEARVTEINPMVDEHGLVIVRLALLRPEGLMPGMNANAQILIPEKKCIVVPKQSVVMRSGKAVIFTIEDGLAKWNYVVLGRDNGRELEIISGLYSGQRVITSNNLQLAHDTPVKSAE